MRHQPQFSPGSFPYYRADQKPGLSKGCKRAAYVLLMVTILTLLGLAVANADVIDVWFQTK